MIKSKFLKYKELNLKKKLNDQICHLIFFLIDFLLIKRMKFIGNYNIFIKFIFYLTSFSSKFIFLIEN